VKALIAHGNRINVPMPLLNAVMQINQNQPKQVIQLLGRHFTSLKNVRISILGLSFKPDTDDMRESPAVPIIIELLDQGAVVKAYDPVANHEARKLFPDHKLTLCDTLEEALKAADGIVLVTRWEQFKAVPEMLVRLNPGAIFVDGRRMLDKTSFARYAGIGL